MQIPEALVSSAEWSLQNILPAAGGQTAKSSGVQLLDFKVWEQEL